MKTYAFTIILDGALEMTPELIDALFEAGCDDGSLGSSAGVLSIDFDREAPSLGEAIASAIRDIDRSGSGVVPVRVEVEGAGDLVTAGEIARRLGQSRESIRLYATGDRGPGGFPAPAARQDTRTPLYRWDEVARWMEANGWDRADLGSPGDDPATVELINGALAVRRTRPKVAGADHVLEMIAMGGTGNLPAGAVQAKTALVDKSPAVPLPFSLMIGAG